VIDGRAVVGALLVAAGSVLAVAGPAPMVEIARWVGARAGTVLLGLGVAVALWSAVPRDRRRQPLLFVAAGVVVLSIQHGVDLSVVVGGMLIAVGALVPGFRPGEGFRDDVDPIHTYRRVGYPRGIAAKPNIQLPRQIRVRAVGLPVPVRVNLRDAEPGESWFLEIVLTCWFAQVVIDLQPRWAVVAGRVAATRKVAFVGQLDSSDLVTDLEDAKQAAALHALAERKSKRYEGHETATAIGVVIHVAGAFSKVILAGR
jgi:hypothetical protein